jgi:hypothetical protein
MFLNLIYVCDPILGRWVHSFLLSLIQRYTTLLHVKELKTIVTIAIYLDVLLWEVVWGSHTDICKRKEGQSAQTWTRGI